MQNPEEEGFGFPDTPKMHEVRQRICQLCQENGIAWIDTVTVLLAMSQVGNGEGPDFFIKPEKLKAIETLCLERLGVSGNGNTAFKTNTEVSRTPRLNAFWNRLKLVVALRKSTALSLSDIMIAFTTEEGVHDILAKVGVEISIA